MPEIDQNTRGILLRAQNPGQYVGGEVNSIVKDRSVRRLALGFPDTYAIGMSNHGCRILYEIVNALPDWACERVYAPLPDMEALLREKGLPLATLETRTGLRDCDVVSFSLQYELCTGAFLTMLDLGGVPLTRFEREGDCPLVIAGGHAVFNPEPFSDFFDLFVIGEGEEALPEILRIVGELRGRVGRAELVRTIALQVSGVYAPALYATREEGGFTVVAPSVQEEADAPYPVRRRVLENFAAFAPPRCPVVPVVETVHERIVLEIMRGCPNGCRFCQAGMICRPLRERPVAGLVENARENFRRTGYDEIGLLSLSTSDYGHFDQLLAELDAEFAPLGVNISLPSLRVDHTLTGIPKRLHSVRKSGLTIAPEAGTDRLRAVINKDVTNDNLLASVEEAFRQGWRNVKLYFMIGLPTETDEDVAAIVELSNAAGRLRPRGKARGAAVTASVSNYIPKPFTPFQWEEMDSPEEFARKQDIIARGVCRKNVDFKGHDPRVSFLEGVFARADRRLGAAILHAWRAGARLEAWSDHFRPELWEEAFRAAGIDARRYACASRALDAVLPWEHIDSGLRREFFLREREKSRQQVPTPQCSAESCAGCGVAGCAFLR